MVSIVVPVYKVEPFLRICVDSILGQTYRDLQVILVDDGSPDCCGDICDEYARKDNRVLSLHKKNGGVSSARNYGLKYATGEYITFCDSDDAYEAEWIEKLVTAMESAQADTVVGGFSVIDESGVCGQTRIHETGIWETDSYERKIRYCFQQILSEVHGWEIWDRLFFGDIIRQHNICFCETCGNYAEDLGFVLSYTLWSNRVAVIDHCGYLYRTRTGSMMQSSVSVPKLESVQAVFVPFEDQFCAFCNGGAEQDLAAFYFQMVAGQFIPKVWGSGMEPEELRKEAIARVPDWADMQIRLKTHLKHTKGWNPWYSGSYNAEVISHMQFLLGGSWTKLRLQCKLIRLLRPAIDRYGKRRTATPGKDQ